MKQTKKFFAVILALVLSVSLLPTTGVNAASKKVKLNKTKATIYVGKTVALKLKNNKKKVKWSTSNKKVATVTKKGKVKGKKAGKATITAKVGKKKYKCKITVKKKATPKPTTKPTEQPTTKPTNPTEQPTTKPVEIEDDWIIEDVEKGVSVVGYKGQNTDIVIPSEIQGKKVVSIGEDAFYGSENLKSVVIPEGVTDIKCGAFFRCRNLITVTFPDTLKVIEVSAFAYCTSLTKITIPTNVEEIQNSEDEGSAFTGCYILKNNFVNKSKIDAEQEHYWGITLFDEEINGLCISNNTILRARNLNIKEVIFPDGITGIGSRAFWMCSSLTSITIPDSVTSIESGAFLGCSSLTSVRIPDSVTDIGGFTSTTTLQPGLHIADTIFSGCGNNLTIIGKSDSVIEIWAKACDYNFVAE